MVEDSAKVIMYCLVHIARRVLGQAGFPTLYLTTVALSESLPVTPSCSFQTGVYFQALSGSRRCSRRGRVSTFLQAHGVYPKWTLTVT